MNNDDVVKLALDHYIDSGDFNGYPIRNLLPRFDNNRKACQKALLSLISNSKIEIAAGVYHPNPHIKAFSNVPQNDQKEWVTNDSTFDQVCIYPHPQILNSTEINTRFGKKPYTLEMAKGAGQLDFRSFDLSILEFYKNDPRYEYKTDFISGNIHITDEHYEKSNTSKHDKIFLQTFGFSYSEDLSRYVAVFLRYLSGLSAEHQSIWKAKETSDTTKLHPDYFRMSILGDWGTGISIFDAFISELNIINKMSLTIGKPNLFRKSFDNNKPKEFGFLLRPTLNEFNKFILLYDQMLSDNINKKFFIGDILFENEEVRPDGKIEVRQKGTIQLLEEWISKFFRPANKSDIDNVFDPIKKIRQLRQKPAHSISEDTFDQKYFKDQRQIVIDGYQAVRTIRLILANHPLVRANPPEIPDLLFKGHIWDI